MTAELILGIVLVVALVILILLAVRQEKLETAAMEEMHQKIKAGLPTVKTQETVEVVVAAEKVMEEAVAPAPVETPVVVEAVVETPKVEEVVAEVKPKKKRKYKKKNPQSNK